MQRGYTPLKSVTQQHKCMLSFTYNITEKQWLPLQSSHCAPYKTKKLVFMTYNIWFDEYKREIRFQALLDLIQRKDPDVIALQEVTPHVIGQLTSNKFIQDSYVISDPGDGSTVKPYGVLLLTKFKIHSFGIVPLPSKFNRMLFYFDVTINDQHCRIASAHFDSEKQASSMRGRQLDVVRNTLENFDLSVVMGDFNFYTNEEREMLLSHHLNGFMDLGKEFPIGPTYDTTLILMKPRNFVSKIRIDLILYKSSLWKGTSSERLGDTPIHSGNIFISDHCGMFGILENV